MFAKVQIKYITTHCPQHSWAVLSPHHAVIKSYATFNRYAHKRPSPFFYTYPTKKPLVKW